MTSKYRGVRRHSQVDRWVATLNINCTQKYLGLFATEREAAEAVDDARMQRGGDYRKLNFPERYAPPTEKLCSYCNQVKPIGSYKPGSQRCAECRAKSNAAKVREFRDKHGMDRGMKYRTT